LAEASEEGLGSKVAVVPMIMMMMMMMMLLEVTYDQAPNVFCFLY